MGRQNLGSEVPEFCRERGNGTSSGGRIQQKGKILKAEVTAIEALAEAADQVSVCLKAGFEY